MSSWSACSRLSVDKLKWDFFQVVAVSIQLYGCTTWTLTKCMEKNLNWNYTRMLCAVLNKSWKQHPTKQQLYRHLPPISKIIQVRLIWYVGHCWRSKDKFISVILLWTTTYGHANVGQPARNYNCFVWTLHVVLRTYWEWWMVGTDGEGLDHAPYCKY